MVFLEENGLSRINYQDITQKPISPKLFRQREVSLNEHFTEWTFHRKLWRL
uniref:Uncharacterized protein n=1 Tax=Rhizophagus irregularis (strain DAOM 181602 / DAOM 197198 / MUCL 43194) TaxID=747089 RepID=U9T4P8_RHIID